MAWERADPRRLLEYARRSSEEGFSLLEKGDPYTAAEKVWEGVWFATLALAVEHRDAFNPRENRTWRERVERALADAGLGGEEARELANVFLEARQRLHGEIYLARFYEEREHKPAFERARRYIERVASLLNPS